MKKSFKYQQQQQYHSSQLGIKSVIFVFIIFLIIILGLTLFIEPRKRDKTSNHNHQIEQIQNTSQIDSRSLPEEVENNEILPITCPIGSTYYPEFHECIRNIYWPDPVDTSLQDITCSPCEDFYTYSCGAFNSDPQNEGQDATFKHLYESNQKIIKDIITSVITTEPSSKLSIFYNSCIKENIESATTDTVSIESKLFKMIETQLKTTKDVSYIMGLLQKYDTVLPLELSFELDPKNADILVPLLKQGGIFASSVSDISKEEHLLSIKQRFQKYTHEKDALFMAKSVVSIEEDILSRFSDTAARNIVEYIDVYESSDRVTDWKRTFYTSQDSFFNLTSFFTGACPESVPLSTWMSALSQSHLWCHTVVYIKQLSDVIKSHSVASWIHYFKHALIFHLVDDGVPHIDPGSHYAFHREYDSQHSLPWRRMRRFLSIKDSLTTSREEECVFQTQAYLPIILDNYFVHAELDSLTRIAARDIVEHVRDTFIRLIPKLNIFINSDVSVIDYAISKISATVIHIGMPDMWPIDRSGLVLSPSSYYENIIAIRKYHMEQNYNLFVKHIFSRQRVSPDELFDGLLTLANGIFQHQLNTVTLNAGLLRPPVFSRLYDNISKFARLGYLVAHELAHALDDNGSNFNKYGAIDHWYNINPDVKACLIATYSVSTPHGNSQDGKKTLQENFADTLGFLVSYEAFLSYQEKYGFQVTLDQQQEFYLAFSQLYCESVSYEEETRILKLFSHSLSSIRVNSIISQFSYDFDNVWHCPLSLSPSSSLIASPCIYVFP